MTQVSAEEAMVKSRWMLGRAMFTMVPSSTTISWAAAMTKIASPAWRSLGGAVADSGGLVLLACAMVLSGAQGGPMVASPATHQTAERCNPSLRITPAADSGLCGHPG